MPPKKQNQRSLYEIEMEEKSRQIQLLHEIVNIQQALLEEKRRRFDDRYVSDSSSSRSSRSHRRQLRINDMKLDIQEFEGKLQPDEFVDWIQTIECLFEYKEVP